MGLFDTLFENRCYHGGKKHNFKPRYSEKTRSGIVEVDGSMSIESYRDFMTLEVYEGDVCKWCGETIKNETR